MCSYVYKNIKCSLNTIIQEKLGEKNISILKKAIEERCLSISQKAVKASQLIEAMIYTKYFSNDKRELPDFDKDNTFLQLFTQGCEIRKRRKPNELMGAVWKEYFEKNGYPKSKRFTYDYNLITTNAQTFKTAFRNNLTMNFLSRQKQSIREYLNLKTKKRADKIKVKNLQYLISNWKKGTRLSDDNLEKLAKKHEAFIASHQEKLPRTMDGRIRFPQASIEYLDYYCFLLSQKTSNDNWFPIVPENKVKIRNIDFDAVGVKSLYSELFGKSESLFKSNEERWASIFDLEKINKMSSSKWKFAENVTTDGISCSIRYHRVEYRKRHLEENKDKSNIIPYNARIIGIDPGRKIMAFCAEIANTEPRRIVRKMKMSAAEYYTCSGIKKFKKQAKEWAAPMKEWADEKGKIPSRNFEERVKCYLKKYNLLWNVVNAKKWRRAKFRVYTLKHKKLDKFVNSVLNVKENKNDPVFVAYGGAKFKSTGRGEHFSVPNKALARKFEEKAGSRNFTFVNEWNTSKICHRCGAPLDIAKVKESGKKTDNRDLRRCSHSHKDSPSCCSNGVENYKCPLSGVYLHRDANAAANIAIKASVLHQKDRKISITQLTKLNLIDKNRIDKKSIKFFYVKKRKPGGCVISDL